MSEAASGAGVTTTLGPVEWVAIAFSGDEIGGEVVDALARLADSGLIHIVDLLVVRKDSAGTVTARELDDLDGAALAALDALDGDVLALLGEDDIPVVGAELAPDTTALVVLWENLWAAGFARAVRDAGGVLIAHDRIPYDAVEVAMAAAEAGAGGEGTT
jgi:Family of unknown function (DUF6325)